MGFLAYFVIGGLVGLAATYYFPGFSPSNKASKKQKRAKTTYLLGIILGFVGGLIASYGGQIAGVFTAGQMIEWVAVIVGATLLTFIFFILIKLIQSYKKIS